MGLSDNNQLLTKHMGQLIELIIIFPEGKVRLFTLLVIPNLLASATICGIGELANAFVLVTTGLKRIFLLLVLIAWLFSVLQNHLLNFLLEIQVFVNFSNMFCLCSTCVLICASLSAQEYDLNLAPKMRYKPVFCTDSMLLDSAFVNIVVQAGTANWRTLNTWHLSTLRRSVSLAPKPFSLLIIHTLFHARPTIYLLF